MVDSFEFIGNSNGSSNNQSGPSNDYDQGGFYDDITPVDDGEMPF